VPYTVYFDGGSAVVWVGQQSNGGQWILFGTWNFYVGATGTQRVRLRRLRRLRDDGRHQVGVGVTGSPSTSVTPGILPGGLAFSTSSSSRLATLPGRCSADQLPVIAVGNLSAIK
jgi:hypothetical protein